MDNFKTLDKNSIDRRTNLSLEDFIEEYEKPNKPVIIAGALNGWRASKEWTFDKFLAKYGNTYFKTNGTDEDSHSFQMLFKDYYAYMLGNEDEKPIYLFDNKFHLRAPDLLEDYEVPVYFKEDLFECTCFALY